MAISPKFDSIEKWGHQGSSPMVAEDRWVPPGHLVKEAVLVVDPQSCQILQCNELAAELTGYSQQELQALRWSDLHPDSFAEDLLRSLGDLPSSSTLNIPEVTLQRRDGHRMSVTIQIHGSLTSQEDGQPSPITLVYRRKSKEREEVIPFQKAELETLTEIGRVIASGMGLEEALDQVMQKLGSLCQARYVALFLLGEDGALGLHRAHKFPPDEAPLYEQPWRVGLSEGPYGQILQEKNILVVEHALADPTFERWRPIAQKIGYAAFIALPLIPKGEPIGLLALYYQSPKKFSPTEIDFLRAVCAYLAIAIENDRLHREYKGKADQLAAINEITNSINASLELEEIIKTIALEIKRIVDFDHISIVLFDDAADKFQLYSLATEELGMKLPKGKWVPIGREGLGWLKLTPGGTTSVPVDEHIEDIFEENKKILEEELHSRINVLLLSKDKYLGTLSLGKMEPRAYTRAHQELFQQIASQIATALENARLYQEAKRRLTELSVLADVSQTISSSLDIQEVLDRIVRAAAMAMDAKICTIWFVTSQNQRPYITHENNGYSQLLQSSLREKLTTVVNDKKPLIIQNLEEEQAFSPNASALLRKLQLKSYLGVPIISRGKPIAILSVYKDYPHYFQDREIKLLMTIANQAALAIENARLFERERRRAAQLAMVNEVGKKITSTLDLEKLLNIVSEAICEIFHYEQVGIYLTDATRGKAVLKSFSAKAGTEERSLCQEFPLDRGLVGYIWREGKTASREDLPPEEHLHPCFPEQGSELCVPLKIADKIIGILILISERPYAFDRRDIQAFEVLAGQLASAIENARLFEETRRNTEQLARANKELENFVFTVSHDLKSPIVSIHGFSTMLLNEYRDKLDEEALHYLDRIQYNINQMERLIQDLLELSRVGQVVNPFENVDVGKIVQTALSELQYQWEEKGIEIVVAPNLPTLYCDRARIVQVFTNLIGNAIKYMGDNPHPRIEIGYKDQGNQHLFFIRDNGIGIDKAYHEKIFDLFYTLKEVQGVEGTGVGLTIVKRIIENHQGQIWVESEKGKGSTFYFTIPKKLAIKSSS